MAAKRKSLGKGLNELLSANLKEPPVAMKKAQASISQNIESAEDEVRVDIQESTLASGERLKNIALDQLEVSRFQPREHIAHEGIEQLAESIKAQGIIQPIIVRQTGLTSYEIIAGERRFRASKLAGLKEIPAIVKDITDDAALAIALIENIQREDLNALEEAKALKRLSEELNMTHLQVAEAVGKSRVAVTNLLRLLNLSEDVQQMLERGELEMGHARALLSLKAPMQSKIAREIVAKGLSVREVEKMVQRIEDPVEKNKTEKRVDPDIRRLQDELSGSLGAKVVIKHNAKNSKGMVMIAYNNLDELDGILEHIN